MIKVFVVILNFNGYKNTIECIQSLNKIVLPSNIEKEIVIIDNASSDGSFEKIQEKFPKITVIQNKENLGFTGGCNVGIEYSIENNADFVLLLNNDTIVDKNLVQNLISSVEDGVGGVVPKIYFEKGYEFHKKYKVQDLGKVIWYAGGLIDWKNLIGKNEGVDQVDVGQFDERRQVSLATGCCLLISAKVIKEVGMFNENYFLYYEDADLSERILRKGFKIIYEPKAVVWHKNAESSGGSGSSLQDYYITRNRLLFGMKYAPIRTRIALIREATSLLKSGRKWQKIGVRDYFLKHFGKGSYII